MGPIKSDLTFLPQSQKPSLSLSIAEKISLCDVVRHFRCFHSKPSSIPSSSIFSSDLHPPRRPMVHFLRISGRNRRPKHGLGASSHSGGDCGRPAVAVEEARRGARRGRDLAVACVGAIPV
ncbi:hypothetical protein U1Q18_034757 [Sarracenia purpurea var. burkii]